MTLQEIVLKEAYDSDVDDILRDFYVPVLTQSISYRRICGFFSSTTLAIAAKGMYNFIKNKGKIKLICSAKFSESDIGIINDVFTDSKIIISNNFQNELINLDEGFVKDHLKAFGWLLANNLIDIKIAIPLNDFGSPLDSFTVEKTSLFHQKVGILNDANGNIISFSGSQNETLFGWYYNIEEFKVFKSWIIGDKNKLEADIKKFEKYWNGDTKRTIVIDLPEAIERNLLEIAPKSIKDLKLDKWINKKSDNKIKVNLRNYQLKAIENWKNNNYKGIFEMATGTGKTFTALGCLNDITKIESKLVTIVACPNNHLITQWKREIDKFGFDCDMIIADSTKRKWKDVLADKIIDINIDNINNLIILTTHNTLTSYDFKSIFEKSNVSNFLIVDEVHGIGSPKRRENLLNNFKYKLGLSATPERWFDEEGTEFINNYFSGIVYKFPLSKAISRFLSEYEYHPYFINLTEQELEEYELKTKKLAKAYFASKNKQEKEEWYQLICFTRQNIVKNAEKKFEILKNILNKNKNYKHLIVYSTPDQISTIQDILNKLNIIQHKFTQKEGTKSKEEYEGLSERDFLLKNFQQGHIQALVAIKCLDEGVDIPQAKNAIMMANSGNPREFIQRRGRILRKYPGKKHSIIYDIIVKPQFNSIEDHFITQIEKRIFKKEIIRYKEFAELAKNSIDCLKIIDSLEEEYGIYW